jgi:molybdopterin/thiamine biosynthesis adenylyltransferase
MTDIFHQSKYDRAERIIWWDQAKLKASRVLVVGAGALGNEIVKNLALVGVGHISIVDMDHIEHTNLSRCLFFRESDEGKPKAEVLAREAHRMNNDVSTNGHSISVQTLGDGTLADFDLIIAGLDNREARVWLGAAARRMGKTWIDGAIEGLMGKVQTFLPSGPCYACTMNEKDWELLAKRKSCTLLGVDEIIAGHTPTNATTSSIIAGVQSQEAIKYLVQKPELYAIENKAWRMIGEQMSTFFSEVEEDTDCPFHVVYRKIIQDIDLPESLQLLLQNLGLSGSDEIRFFDDFLQISGCDGCETEEKIGFKDLMRSQGKCVNCGQELKVESHFSINEASLITSAKNFPEYWPYKTVIDVVVRDQIMRYRVINNGGKSEEI